jgi:hypothetical protein
MGFPVFSIFVVPSTRMESALDTALSLFKKTGKMIFFPLIIPTFRFHQLSKRVN